MWEIEKRYDRLDTLFSRSHSLYDAILIEIEVSFLKKLDYFFR